MGSYVSNIIAGDSSKKRSSHQKSTSEPLIDLNETPRPQEVINKPVSPDTMRSECQKKPKHSRQGSKTAASSEDDGTFEEHANPKPQTSPHDSIVKNLETKLEQQNSENDTLKKTISSFRDHAINQDHLIRDLKYQLNNLQVSQKELQGAYYSVEDQVENLERKLKKEKETCEQLRAHWMDATEELEQLQKTSRKFHVDDESVISAWNGLAYRIRNLSSKASTNKSALHVPTPEQFQNLGYVASHFEKYFPSHPSILFESYIWSKLLHIIAAPSKIWSYKAGRAVCHVADSILCDPDSSWDDMIRCQEWRSETNHLLHDYCKKMDNMDDDMQAQLIQKLSLPFKQCSAYPSRDELVTDLRGILDKLFELCSIIARAKAAYVPFIPIPNDDDDTDNPRDIFQFEEHTMEFRAITSPEQGLADFVVSPALAKYGNSDGENYDQREILYKVGVAI